MALTKLIQLVRAPKERVYAALTDAHAIATWKVPDGMTCKVHEFEAREGGRFRVSLTYDMPNGKGKTVAQTDTYHGYFEKLVPGEVVIERTEFESSDPALLGEMRIVMRLIEVDGGTEIHVEHEGLPAVVNPADNELGWKMSLSKLAALVEQS